MSLFKWQLKLLIIIIIIYRLLNLTNIKLDSCLIFDETSWILVWGPTEPLQKDTFSGN